MTLRGKLMLVVGLGGLSLLLMISNAYVRSNHYAERLMMESMQRNLMQAKEYIDYRMREIEQLSATICTDTAMNNALEDARRSRFQRLPKLENYFILRPRFENLAINYSLYSIRLYLDDDIFLSEEETFFFPLSKIESEPWYEDTLLLQGAPNWVSGFNPTDAQDERVLYLTRVVRGMYSDSNLGVLSIALPMKSISQTLNNAVLAGGGAAALIDRDGNLTYTLGTGNPERFLSTSSGDRRDGVLITEASLALGGLKLVAYVPYSAVTASGAEQLISDMLMILLVIGCMLLIVYTLTHSILKRVNNIAGKLENIENNRFEELIESCQNDELGKLETTFNRMSQRIHSLISEVYELEIQRKAAEMITLQAQIKPHFLYNILDSINWMAWDGNTQEISKVVTSLGKFFRLSLSAGREIIPLLDEVEIARQYVYLQQVRYVGTIDAHFTVDEEALSCLSPKLLLQPIIENSVKHGILPRRHRGKGTIWIKIRCEDGMIYASIVDDGKNLSEKDTYDVDSESSVGGYGLSNIHERLKLLYDDNYSLSIFKNEMGNTEVNISWPAIPYEDEV